MPEPIGVIPPDILPPKEVQGAAVPAVRRRRRHVGRWVVLGVAVLVVAFVATVADAYLQAVHAGKELKTLVPMLQRAREDLLSGAPDGAARFQRAEAALREVQASVDGARFTFGWTGAMPFVGRPVQAVRLGADAAEEAMAGLRLGREIVGDLTGDREGGLLHDHEVNLALVRSLRPRISQILDHLVAARQDLAAIPSIPLFHALDRLKADALTQADAALQSGRRALAGVGLLPSLLGADGPRTYFLALQNNADLRGTGGAVLAWGIVRVADGEIHLQDGGSVGTLDERGGTRNVELPQPVRWYHLHTGRPLVVNNGANYSPNFPVVASVWADMVEQLRHTKVDGVIAIDPEGAAALFAGQPAVTIPSSPVPIDASTIASFTEHGQYSLPRAAQKALAGQLVAAAFAALTNPHDVLKMTGAVGTALADKRIQLWLRDATADRELHAMGWDGAIRPGTGDYLYLVDNKRNPNKVDYFSRATLDDTVRLDPDGTGHAAVDLELDTNVPSGESPTVVGPSSRYGLNVAMLSLHVPEDARTTSHSSTEGVNYETKPLGFIVHKESGVKVLTQTVASWSGHPGGFHVAYDIPGVAHRNADGTWTYTLALQHQPMVHPLHVTVTVVAPLGTRFTGSEAGWRVEGNRAVFETDLTRDTVTSLTYGSGASPTAASTP
ncbi:MAG TPA: DUF4012 domain-containing protein [Actinomycetota bacterium]|nr:DUF4012 domain-containing protein [Actinomycetota bacterium]